MRKFGLSNILGGQPKKSAAEDMSINNASAPAPAPIRKYSAYRTIINRHNEAAQRLQNQPVAAAKRKIPKLNRFMHRNRSLRWHTKKDWDHRATVAIPKPSALA